MKLEQIEAMLPNFSNELLTAFGTNQLELKQKTVQKMLTILEQRKVDTNIAKTPEFWQRVKHNMELFKMRTIDEIENVLHADFNKEEKLNFFLNYVDKNTPT